MDASSTERRQGRGGLESGSPVGPGPSALEALSTSSPGAGHRSRQPRPRALVVLLEGVGYIAGHALPSWLMAAVDHLTEEYAKRLLRGQGVHRHYHRVVILEDAQVTGPTFVQALGEVGATHRVDLLLLVHGLEGCLVGFQGRQYLGAETFRALQQLRRRVPGPLELGIVYGVNCFGASLAPTWLELGAQAVAGAVGVNWFPEPSLRLFLGAWTAGARFSRAVEAAYLGVQRLARVLTLGRSQTVWPAWLRSSRPVILGQRDPRLHEHDGLLHGQRC